ncbi:MAG: archaetidylserine decarboxylase [Polyangiales bacterium]
MTFRDVLQRVTQVEALNFALTNGIPRQLVTRLMGWFSQIEQPLVRDASLATWKLFTDLDLTEAKTQDFRSLHDCFVRELKPGARPLAHDPRLLVSPCDGIVGAHGQVDGDRLFQAKGSSYTLQELLLDPELAARYRNGSYVTLRLTSAMYHRFHAPHDCTIEHVTYVAGDTWNTNPITVKRVPKLYCKNERAILHARLRANGDLLAIVPVAAILVASIRLHCLDVLLHLRHPGPNDFSVNARYEKGEELGYFQHGSTVVMFAPAGYRLSNHVTQGAVVRMGEPLLHLPERRG